MTVISAESTAEHYEAAHDRIAHLVRSLTPEQERLRVPGTPLWTVHDVLAHLSAIPADIAAGRLKGIPKPDQTQAQVEARRDRRVAELLAEWGEGLPPVVEAARAGLIPPPLAIDAITHEQDLRGALGLGPLGHDGALRYAATGYALGLRRRLEAAGLPPLRLCDPARGFEVVTGEGEPAATVSGPEFELFRAMSGRRSRKQVAALEWDGDPEPYLDVICVFGPLPEDPVVD